MITKAQIQRHARQAGQSLVYFETEVIQRMRSNRLPMLIT
jgi:hypothetical protein